MKGFLSPHSLSGIEGFSPRVKRYHLEEAMRFLRNESAGGGGGRGEAGWRQPHNNSNGSKDRKALGEYRKGLE